MTNCLFLRMEIAELKQKEKCILQSFKVLCCLLRYITENNNV